MFYRSVIFPSILLLTITFVGGSLAADTPHCINPNDPDMCVVYQSPVKALQCPGNYKGSEMRFVCKTGRNAGKGWDIWCRTSDGKCNLSEREVCPSGGLTQWHPYDHCTQGGAQPNWTPPPDLKF
jgi:hypothetical protein